MRNFRSGRHRATEKWISRDTLLVVVDRQSAIIAFERFDYDIFAAVWMARAWDVLAPESVYMATGRLHLQSIDSYHDPVVIFVAFGVWKRWNNEVRLDGKVNQALKDDRLRATDAIAQRAE